MVLLHWCIRQMRRAPNVCSKATSGEHAEITRMAGRLSEICKIAKSRRDQADWNSRCILAKFATKSDLTITPVCIDTDISKKRIPGNSCAGFVCLEKSKDNANLCNRFGLCGVGCGNLPGGVGSQCSLH